MLHHTIVVGSEAAYNFSYIIQLIYQEKFQQVGVEGCLHAGGLLVLSDLYLFVNANTAPVSASVRLSFFTDFFSPVSLRNTGRSGGLSKSSCILLPIDLVHRCSLGVLYFSPCFSFSCLNISSTASSFSCRFDTFSSLLRFFLQPKSSSSSDWPSHHNVISPLGYFQYMVQKSSLVTNQIFEWLWPSKYPTLKLSVSGTRSLNSSMSFMWGGIADSNFEEQLCRYRTMASLLWWRFMIFTLYALSATR